jgi:uncharacterized protein DUF3309
MELLVVMMALLVAAIAALPAWPYSVRWGYAPTGACGVAVGAMVVLVLMGRL